MMKSNSSEKKIILHLEDSQEDAEIIENILRKGELIFDIYLVSEFSEFKKILKTIKPDVILSDFDLPGFDGFEALKISIDNDGEVPFIFVTGAVGEEMAVNALKSGATDFILKNNLGRLVPAVERAMDESRIVLERKKLYYTLKNSEERYRTLMENLPVGVFRTSFSSPGIILQANLSAAYIHGFETTESFMEYSVEDLYFNPEDRKILLSEIIEFKKIKSRLIRFKKRTGESFWGSISASCHIDKSGNPDWIDGVLEDVTERVENERELKRINEELDLLISSLSSIIIGVSVKDRVTHWNPFAEKVFDIKAEDIIGKQFAESGIKWNWGEVYEAIGNSVINEKSVRIDELRFEKSDGSRGILGFNINPLKRGGDILEGFMILGRDITEKKIIETQLLQTNKLEAIGQLAAGVAHEINSPLQYVGDNLKFLNKSFAGLSGLLEIFTKASKSIDDAELCNMTMRQADELSRKIKLPFLLEQLPLALEQSLDGVERVSKIVQSMKAFSHPGTGSKMPTNINRSIENTVTISRNEWKYDCELELNLDPELPLVPCFESEFNQVILNLIVNAADAVHEAKLKDENLSGLIKIYTTLDNGYAVIKVEDNGSGIPERIKKRIFDPFFTTKDVGKGTGQGLPISHSIIVEKHGGMLYFESEAGRGTVFYIKLPLEEN